VAKKRERSREYLEAALERARKVLNPRDYALIFQASRASAGGQIAARNRRERMTECEKAIIFGARSLSRTELEVAHRRLIKAFTRTGDQYPLRRMADPILAEMRRRGMEPTLKLSAMAPVVKADRTDDPGVMVAFRLSPATASALAIPGGEKAEGLHVTVAYLGRYSGLGPEGILIAGEAVQDVAAYYPPLEGTVGGVARFPKSPSSDGKDVVVALVDVANLERLHVDLVTALEQRGIGVVQNHGYVPHVTLAYVDPEVPTPAVPGAMQPRDVRFEEISLSVNGADTNYPLGVPSAVAAVEPFDIERALEAMARGENVDLTFEAQAEVVEDLGDAIDVCLEGGEAFEVGKGFEGNIEPGEMVSIRFSPDAPEPARLSPAPSPSHADEMRRWAQWVETVKAIAPVDFVGPDDAPLLFVSIAPSPLEALRKEPMVGPDGNTFADLYLAPLRLSKADVAIGFCVPVPVEPSEKTIELWRGHVIKAMQRYTKARVVALGKAAKEALGDVAHFALPHPAAVRKKGDRGEVTRKLRGIRKTLDESLSAMKDKSASSQRGVPAENLKTSGKGDVLARIAKSDEDRQIIYAVVLDPYQVDLQNDWVPPAEIEQTAHDFLAKSRVIGFRHRGALEGAEVVESLVELYPSPEDRRLAFANQPHRAYRRKFGADTIHSGAWVLGVRLPDEIWAMYKRGEIDAFSIGGSGVRTPMPDSIMPKVEFIELVPSP
jgi:2'-5' RNA ligase